MANSRGTLDESIIRILTEAVRDTTPVTEYTHAFYRYPARFSPAFARAAIELFSRPEDLVLDPFMGGGTTLVEALMSGRRAIGIDVSALAAFVSRTKTTPLSERDLAAVLAWVQESARLLNMRTAARQWNRREVAGDGAVPWRMKKAIRLMLDRLDGLEWRRQRDFARAVILRTGQWALDCRTKEPSVEGFRMRLLADANTVVEAMRHFSDRFRSEFGSIRQIRKVRCILRGSAQQAAKANFVSFDRKPTLVVTSPPYPGVHVVYHRWQIRGRRESSIPFWIANCTDGQVESYFTMGSRKSSNQEEYFERVTRAFRAVRSLLADNATVVQLVGFSNPGKYLPSYLKAMSQAGFTEIETRRSAERRRGRLWRDVPNRKWYADAQGKLASSREVLLLHTLS